MGLLSTIGAASGRAFGFTRSAIAAATDAFFNQVTLLLPGNGTNGAQNNTFLDSSTNNFTITRNGNTTQGTFSPFSQMGWSVQFDRADYNNLLIPSSSDFDFSSGNFTIECWINPQALPAAGDGSFHWIFATSNLVAFFFSGNIYFRNQATTELVTPVAHGMSSGVWYHLAFVRSGSNYAIYRNGSSISTGSGSTVASGASALTIAGSSGFNGITACTLSNFRITNGQALYTGAFTPSTSPLTTTSQGATASNVKLLTCQSNRFVDNSTQNTKTIQFGSGTTIGNRTIQPFSPFAPTAAYSAATVGGSGYFDGSGDYLSLPTSANLELGSSDFTFEGWVYLSDTSDRPVMYWNANSSGYAALHVRAITGKWALWMSTSGGSWAIQQSALGTATPNAWSHFAVVRSGTNVKLFINGADVTSGGYTLSGSLMTTYTKNEIGAYNTTSNIMLGYIGSSRLTIGGALSISVPTAPYTTTVTTGTCRLLTNYTNAGITDATAKNVLETVGNAQISTTQSKFGGSSIFFNGTTDKLITTRSPLFNFGSSDFTVEGWFYTGSSGTMLALYSMFNGAKTDTFAIQISGGVAGAYVSASGGGTWGILNGTNMGTLNLNAWNHIALVRSGSTWSGYVNGVRGSGFPVTNSSAISAIDGFTIGEAAGAGFWYSGYIDDLRISRYARYSGASFTPATAAFPTQ